MPRKQSSDALSRLAASVLRRLALYPNYQPSRATARKLAACVLSQDEVKGKRKTRP